MACLNVRNPPPARRISRRAKRAHLAADRAAGPGRPEGVCRGAARGATAAARRSPSPSRRCVDGRASAAPPRALPPSFSNSTERIDDRGLPFKHALSVVTTLSCVQGWQRRTRAVDRR